MRASSLVVAVVWLAPPAVAQAPPSKPTSPSWPQSLAPSWQSPRSWVPRWSPWRRDAQTTPGTRGNRPWGRGSRAVGTGSGVILSLGGWILPKEHVVSRAARVTIRLHDGREMGDMMRRDQRCDGARVKVEGRGSRQLGAANPIVSGSGSGLSSSAAPPATTAQCRQVW